MLRPPKWKTAGLALAVLLPASPALGVTHPAPQSGAVVRSAPKPKIGKPGKSPQAVKVAVTVQGKVARVDATEHTLSVVLQSGSDKAVVQGRAPGRALHGQAHYRERPSGGRYAHADPD